MSMATKHDMFGIYNEELPYIKPQRSFLPSSGFAKSSKILDLLYLYYHKANGHQIW